MRGVCVGVVGGGLRSALSAGSSFSGKLAAGRVAGSVTQAVAGRALAMPDAAGLAEAPLPPRGSGLTPRSPAWELT